MEQIDVWFDADCITNVLSFAQLQKNFRIVYDNTVGDIFKLFTPKGVIQFTQLSKFLYVFKPLLNNQNHQDKSQQKPQANLLNTLKENKTFYTTRQIERAKAARNFSQAIGCLSHNDLKAILKMNSIKDCLIVEEDIKLAERIFGKDIGIIKGKTTCTKPTLVIYNTVEIPHELRMAQYDVTLCIDTFFVNKMAFFHTISDKIAYRTSQWIPDQTLEIYQQTLDLVFKMYQQAGFKVKYICSDREFEPLLQSMMNEYGILPNNACAQEHVLIVERSIRVVKERCRTTIHSNPFKSLPRILIKAIVQECTRKLNFFPVKGSCSPYYSPREIMHELKLSYKQCSIPQLSYVLAHDKPNPTNSTKPRALDGIYMRPLSNAQGGHEILHLATNEVIIQRNVTVIPITHEVIAVVEKLAHRDGMKSFQMTSKHGVILYDASTAGMDIDEDIDEENEIEFENNEDDKVDDEDNENDNDEQQQEQQDEMDPDEIYEENYDPVEADQVENEADTEDNEQSQQSINDELDVVNEEDEEEVGEDDLAGDQQPTVRRSTRTPAPRQPMNIGTTTGQTYGMTMNQRAKDYTMYEYNVLEAMVMAMVINHFNGNMEITTVENGTQHVMSYSLKKGIMKFGNEAKNAALKEMKQLHDQKCFVPINKKKLNATEQKWAMESLIFLTEKRDGAIKAQHCANGSTQQLYLEREEVSSPTVSTESTLLTAVIEAEEGHEVATVDIPNVFIQTDVDVEDKEGNKTIIKIRGILVNILCQLDLTYTEFVVIENNQKVLYLHILKAIYGMLMSSLLFYKKLSNDLQGFGFVINPYDPCVANKMVNGKQLTVSWHVDDLKASHMERKTIDEFIQWVKMKYGSIGEVKVTRGKIHDYLDMRLDYTVPGQVSVDMIQYIEGIVDNFLAEELQGARVASPWNENLFKVHPTSPLLAKDKAEFFHTVVAQGLFACKRGRPDIAPAIAYLTTRVKQPNKDDWEKLVRMMKFLKQTSKDMLTLQADRTRIIKWHTDAAFAVHPDFRSHTGATMTMGKGAVTSISRKQGMSTQSSTEAELVAADDVVGSMVWTKNFLKSQGYPVENNVLYQDNRSAILLESDGRQSAGKRSRHLNIRLFFITDQKPSKIQISSTARQIRCWATT